MRQLRIVFATVLIVINGVIYANGLPLTNKQYFLAEDDIPNIWRFGLGWNFVEDDGYPFSRLFNFSESWNYLFYPTQLTIERPKEKALDWYAQISYTKFKSGKLINKTPLQGSAIFISADFNWKYDPSYHFIMGPIQPYPCFGLGFTYNGASDQPVTFTLNTGVGARYWLNKNLGFYIQSSAKWGLSSPLFTSKKNYLHHSFGFLITFEKGEKFECLFCKPKYQELVKRSKKSQAPPKTEKSKEHIN